MSVRLLFKLDCCWVYHLPCRLFMCKSFYAYGMCCWILFCCWLCELHNVIYNLIFLFYMRCPAGSYCASTSFFPVNCFAGKYSNAGALSCTECSPGFACPYTNNATLISCNVSHLFILIFIIRPELMLLLVRPVALHVLQDINAHILI